MNIFVTCIVATFIGMGAWNNIGNSQSAAGKINAICFFCVIHQGVLSSLQGTYAFPLERALMLRERHAGVIIDERFNFDQQKLTSCLPY